MGSDGSGSEEGRFWLNLSFTLVAFLLITVSVYEPAFSGPFISDDRLYIVKNPYVRKFEPSMLPRLFDPAGDAVHFSTGNYAPVHILAHAVEWRLFGEDVRGYRAVNVALHCLNAVLLAALLHAAGISQLWAIVAASLFLVHPANVEAVAWISQLKSVLGLGFALTALLAFRRHPIAGGLLFVLGLLSKGIAGFALPFAAAMVWAWHRAGVATRGHALGLGVWTLALALFAVPQLAATSIMGRSFVPLYPDASSHVRSIFAIGARYLAMAATGYGTSAYHEPEVASSLDPWWWAGLCGALVLSGRIAWTLRRGREEAAWWLGAAAAFVPISQLIPFYFGMADRYLYFILPGLLGGAFACGGDLLGRIAANRRLLRVAAVVAAGILGLQFASHSWVRAGMWTSEYRLLGDATRQYPNGATAHYTRALVAMSEGDADEALAQLEEATERGYHFVCSYHILDIARRQIDFVEQRSITSQRAVIRLSQAYFLLGELDHSIELLEESLRQGGPLQEEALIRLEVIRRERTARRRASDSVE
jgi:hypothetical protein